MPCPYEVAEAVERGWLYGGFRWIFQSECLIMTLVIFALNVKN